MSILLFLYVSELSFTGATDGSESNDACDDGFGSKLVTFNSVDINTMTTHVEFGEASVFGETVEVSRVLPDPQAKVVHQHKRSNEKMD